MQTYQFVLWGKQCDEAMAAIFITTLRNAGLRLKVVGISGQWTMGAHGLSLMPDVSLYDALPLARHAVNVIIPCGAEQLRLFATDPWLRQFLEDAQENGADFIIGQELDQALLHELGLSAELNNITVLNPTSDVEACVAIARQIAQSWSGFYHPSPANPSTLGLMTTEIINEARHLPIIREFSPGAGQ